MQLLATYRTMTNKVCYSWHLLYCAQEIPLVYIPSAPRPPTPSLSWEKEGKNPELRRKKKGEGNINRDWHTKLVKGSWVVSFHLISHAGMRIGKSEKGFLFFSFFLSSLEDSRFVWKQLFFFFFFPFQMIVFAVRAAHGRPWTGTFLVVVIVATFFKVLLLCGLFHCFERRFCKCIFGRSALLSDCYVPSSFLCDKSPQSEALWRERRGEERRCHHPPSFLPLPLPYFRKRLRDWNTKHFHPFLLVGKEREENWETRL